MLPALTPEAEDENFRLALLGYENPEPPAIEEDDFLFSDDFFDGDDEDVVIDIPEELRDFFNAPHEESEFRSALPEQSI
jgi:hypothetical protein